MFFWKNANCNGDPPPLMAKVMKISIFVGFLLYSRQQRKKYHSPDRLGHTDSQEPDTGSLCIWILMGTRHLGPGIIIWLMTIHHYWQSLLNLASFRLHLLWRSSFLFGNQQCTSYSNNSIFIAAQRHKGTLFLVVAIIIITSIITIKVNLEFNLSRRVAVTSLRNALTIFALFSSPATILWFDYYEGSMIMMMMMMSMIIMIMMIIFRGMTINCQLATDPEVGNSEYMHQSGLPTLLYFTFLFTLPYY